MDQLAISNQPTREERIRNIKIVAGAVGVGLFIGLCAATQTVAAACEYDPLLGRCLIWC